LISQDLDTIVYTLSILVFKQSDRDLDQSRWGISIHLAHAWFKATLAHLILEYSPEGAPK